MSQILIAAAATAAVFAVFILAFLIRSRASDEPVHIHRCADCDCDRNDEALQRSRRFLQQRDRNPEPADGRRPKTRS